MDSSISSGWYDNDILPYVQIDKAHIQSIESCCFNPAVQSEICTGGHDKLAIIWDINKLTQINSFQAHTAGVWSIDYSTDGKNIVSGSPDKLLMLWDKKQKKPTSILKSHQNKINSVKFNENGKYIASGSDDASIIIWDLRKTAPLKIITNENKAIVYSVQWSKCGNYIFSSEYGGLIKAFDSQKFNLLDTYGKYQEKERAWSCDMNFSQSSKLNNQIYVGYQLQKNLKTFNFDKQNKKIELESQMVAHFNPIKYVKFNSQKELVATVSQDGSGRVWEARKQKDTKKNKCIAGLQGHKDNISCVDFTNTNQNPFVLATVSWDQSLNLYQIYM